MQLNRLMPAAGPRPNILLAMVDAERLARLARALQDRGCETTTVRTGFHLVETLSDAILGASAERPDLIIVGPKLAGCQEMTVLLGLRELEWKTPFLFLTDGVPAHRLEELQRLGVRFAPYQPFDADAISACVMRTLLKRRGGCAHAGSTTAADADTTCSASAPGRRPADP